MKDIERALEHCIESNCVDCPNNEELGSGEIVCYSRLLPKVLEYINELKKQIENKEQKILILKL